MTEVLSERLDVTKFQVNVKDNPNTRTNIAIIGVGATGSSFLLLLAHFLKYAHNYVISMYDFDHIEQHNNQVSMYGFTHTLGIRNNSNYKVDRAKNILTYYLGSDDYDRAINKHIIEAFRQRVTTDLLITTFGDNRYLDTIFVFTDSNESRYEIAQYHDKYPDTTIFDIRVGSYDQFECYMSKNPNKYNQTIYYEDDGTLTHINANRVCLDDRMSFSIAMTGASMLMNMYTKYMRGGYDNIDFRHVMIGNDFLGEVKGYE